MIPGIKSIAGLAQQYLGLMSLGATATSNSINTNYNTFMSGMTLSTGTILANKISRDTVFTSSSGRYQENFTRTWSPGDIANSEVNLTNVNTIILVGLTWGGTGDALIYPTSVQVNNVSVSHVDWFTTNISGSDSGKRVVSVSYYHFNDSFSKIDNVSAVFDGPGVDDNQFAGATIFVLPGRWAPNTVNSNVSSATTTMTPSDIALYFGSHSNDSAQTDANVITGTRIGYNSGNWYGGQSVGLMYSNNTTITANVSTSTGNSVVAKLTWSP